MAPPCEKRLLVPWGLPPLAALIFKMCIPSWWAEDVPAVAIRRTRTGSSEKPMGKDRRMWFPPRRFVMAGRRYIREAVKRQSERSQFSTTRPLSEVVDRWWPGEGFFQP